MCLIYDGTVSSTVTYRNVLSDYKRQLLRINEVLTSKSLFIKYSIKPILRFIQDTNLIIVTFLFVYAYHNISSLIHPHMFS